MAFAPKTYVVEHHSQHHWCAGQAQALDPTCPPVQALAPHPSMEFWVSVAGSGSGPCLLVPSSHMFLFRMFLNIHPQGRFSGISLVMTVLQWSPPLVFGFSAL